MNIDHFLEGFTWVWIIGGILLLPLNSFVGTFLICLWLKIDPKTWLERVMTPSWILQIVWNLIFFSISLLGSTALESEKGKITYTLTRGEMENWGGDEKIANGKYALWHFNPNVWNFHFYHETDKGKTEIDNFSEEATPFQKAYIEVGIKEGLNPEGLHDVVFSDGSVAHGDGDKIEKRIAFDALSEDEARAYIEHYNTPHPVNYFFSGLLPMIIGAVIAPFLWISGEAFVIGFIAFCLGCPLLAAAIYGPIIYKIGKAGAFKGAY
jgi:hypothetical protein